MFEENKQFIDPSGHWGPVVLYPDLSFAITNLHTELCSVPAAWELPPTAREDLLNNVKTEYYQKKTKPSLPMGGNLQQTSAERRNAEFDQIILTTSYIEDKMIAWQSHYLSKKSIKRVGGSVSGSRVSGAAVQASSSGVPHTWNISLATGVGYTPGNGHPDPITPRAPNLFLGCSFYAEWGLNTPGHGAHVPPTAGAYFTHRGQEKQRELSPTQWNELLLSPSPQIIHPELNAINRPPWEMHLPQLF